MRTKTFILMLTAIFVSGITWAQIIHVPGDKPTIQDGINFASDGDTVLVDEGTYYENIRYFGKAITVASHFIMDGDTSHINNTIIDGSQPADPDKAAVVMFMNGEDTTSIIQGFTITGGSGVVVTTPWSAIMGGGIFTSNSGAKITNNRIANNMITHANYSCGGVGIGSYSTTENHWVVISDNIISGNQSFANSVSSFGGGIYVMNNARIKNNVIEQNSCYNSGTQADGGGIEAEQAEGQDFTVYIDNNLVQNNSVEGTTSGLGGGISCLSVSTIYILNNTITENILLSGDLGFGGGIYANSTGDLIQIKNNTIKNNACDATNSYGAGCSLVQCGISIVTDNEVNDNIISAEGYSIGGGMHFEQTTDTVFIRNNNISGNENGGMGFGGGVGIYNTTFDVLYFDENVLSNNFSTQKGGGLWTLNTYRTNITNNVFDNNEADSLGGAISFRQYLGKAEDIMFLYSPIELENIARDRDDNLHPIIANNNFISNTAARGGAIDSDHGMETPIIFNSIFLNNSAPLGRDIFNDSDSAMFVYNNDIDTSKIYTPWNGSDNILCDPSFTSDSLHLDYPSQCVNAGIESLTINEETYYCPPFDFDGDERPFDGTMPDIGADEAQWYMKVEDKVLENPGIEVYPNPFTYSTTIEYELQQPATVEIIIYDYLGKQVAGFASGSQGQGRHTFSWYPRKLQAGVYYCVLKTNEGMKTLKMIKMK